MANFSITPPPDLSPAQWAEKNIHIPVGNARPGIISFEEAPYQRGMLDAAEDPTIQRISFMLGAQTGKTMTGLCLNGFYTLHKPRSQIMMQPTEGDLRTWLETKFNPMIDANPELLNCYAKPRGREGVNNQKMKSFKGGWLMFSWAGSPATARGRSAPVIICDEVDGYNYVAEGHPVELLWERSSTFGEDRLLIEMSTPTIRGRSRIETSFLEGDCRYFFVVCPKCGHKHKIEWSEQTVRWEKNRPDTAMLHCPKCDKAFDDYARIAMIRQSAADGAGWEATEESFGHASFHLNSLYSPLRKLSHIVQAYLSADSHKSLQSFTNTILAETWEETGEKGDHEMLYQRAEVYDAPVPDGVLMLTAGIDVQADRIEYEVVGWNKDEESWSIDYVVIYGDTTQLPVYRKAYKELKKGYETSSGEKMYVYAGGKDTGFNTGRCYDALRYAGRSPILYALKGKGSDWTSNEVERTSRMKIDKGRWKPDIITVNVNVAKRTVMQRLNLMEPGPGYCHFPHDRDLEYYLQLTAEQLVRTQRHGFPQDRWEKKYERNEAFDCRVYAYATMRLVYPVLSKMEGKATGAPRKRKRAKVKNPFM